MFFSDKVPGEIWQPESAARYNAVNAMLRNAGNAAGNEAEGNSYCLLDFCNASSSVIPAFSAAAVAGDHGDSDLRCRFSRQHGAAVVDAQPAEDDSLPWGIALDTVEPGKTGVMAVCGIVPAHFSGTGKMLTPSSAGLIAGESGSARVILLPDEKSDPALPGLILLGTGTVAKGEYYGVFKLEAVSSAKVKIINGRNPQSIYCGFTDVPGLSSIPVQTLEIDDAGSQRIFLVFFYDESTATYSAEFRTSVPEESVFYLLLGIFDRGIVTQVWQSDSNRAEFGNSWYLV